jgi:hypothetical protein
MRILGAPIHLLIWMSSLVIWITAVVLFAQFGLRFLITYEITSNSIEVILCGVVPLKRIPFADITSVEFVSFKDLLPFVSLRSILAVRLGNRLFGKAVLVTQKSGLFHLSVLTPDNPDEFVRGVPEKVGVNGFHE